MPTAALVSSALAGIEAFPAEIQADLSPGPPAFKIGGLTGSGLLEAHKRIRAAIENSGHAFPGSRITVKLTPDGIQKELSACDLPIALAILAANGVLRPDRIRNTLVLGGLHPGGRLEAIRGAFSVGLMAGAQKFTGVLLPHENAPEAAAAADKDVNILGVGTLNDAVDFLNGIREIQPTSVSLDEILKRGYEGPGFDEIAGWHYAKRALEIAAAGGHHVLMVGSRESARMLASRLPGILPHLTPEDASEITWIHSAAGLMEGKALVSTRPFRAPHYDISEAELIGGGNGPLPSPGELSIAHRGVLFLDNLLAFKKTVLDGLLQPLEEGRIRIDRAIGSSTLPASVLLIGAIAACPCGHGTDGTGACACTPPMIERYRSRLPGPLLEEVASGF